MIQLDVQIMGQSFKLVCKSEEQKALQDAVEYLNDKIYKIRETGKIKGNDRIAIMAALGIAAEFFNNKTTDQLYAPLIGQAREKITEMSTAIDHALAHQSPSF